MSQQPLSHGPASSGFFGKVPTQGDFISRHVPRDFVQSWDEWLKLSLQASKEALGEDWLDAFLTAPVWRFALSAGVAGDAAVAGLMLPSVDAVGRYFPFTVLQPLPEHASPWQAPAQSAVWFDALETVALTVLAETFHIDEFDEAIQSVGAIADSLLTIGQPLDDQNGGMTVALSNPEDVPSSGLPAMLAAISEQNWGAYSIWWTAGSGQLQPAMKIHAGLPVKEAFRSFLVEEAVDAAVWGL